MNVIAIGQFPPPVSGFSYITSCVVEQAGADHHVIRYDTAAKINSKGICKHLSRVQSFIRAYCGLVGSVRLPDRICYIACEGGLGLIYTVLAVALARIFRYPTLLHHHSFSYIDRPRHLMRAIIWLYPKINHVFLCRNMIDKFELTYRCATRNIVLTNAAFVAPHVKVKIPSRAPLVIGHLSNLTREKGLYIFLDMMREAPAHMHGILAGPAEHSDDSIAIEEAIANLHGKLTYLGPVYGSDKDQFYDDIDVFVFPTQYVNEAQPTVLFEALAAGCKVISYDRGCIGRQIDGDGVTVSQQDNFASAALKWLESSGPSIRSDREATSLRYAQVHAAARDAVEHLFQPKNLYQNVCVQTLIGNAEGSRDDVTSPSDP